MATAVETLQDEATEVLARLVRFDTVNPPGQEREAIEWLAAYLSDAGLEVELRAAEPERPSLVATLRGQDPEAPTLGYLSHVDTVLADPGDWRRDPWGGEVHDGFLWGRGALDMKSQTAAEAVALAARARAGGAGAPGGDLKLFCVADEEAGGTLGAKFLTQGRQLHVRQAHAQRRPAREPAVQRSRPGLTGARSERRRAPRITPETAGRVDTVGRCPRHRCSPRAI